MAKIARAKQEIFGSSGATSEFGVFGSDSEGAAATSKDPALIQSLASYLRGWYAATVNATEPPRIQDMNSLFYLFARQIAYGMQAGVPEWLSTENYYANGSVVLGSNGKIYISKTGTDGSPNVGNDPVTDTGANWRFVWTNDVFAAFPLSDLSRVFRLTGDGIPIFPDNVAGTLYKRDKDWTATTGWSGGTGVTLSVEGSLLKVVSTTPGIANAYLGNPAYQNKLIRIIIKSSIPLTNITTITGSSVDTLMRMNPLGGNRYIADIYWARTGSDNFIIWPDKGLTTTPTWHLESIYIGSGLYDTPVYDKACCNRFTNNGVLPVPAPRGQGMLFQGAQYLQADNPVVGTTGTIYGKFKRGLIGTVQILLGNYGASPINGMNAIFGTDNSFKMNVYSAGSVIHSLVIKAIVNDTLDHTWGVIASGTTLTPIFDGVLGTSISGVIVIGSGLLTIGKNPAADSTYYSGTIYDTGYDSRLWSADDALRYHNGDDAVDSQQKSATGTPHAIAVYGADGALRDRGGYAVQNINTLPGFVTSKSLSLGIDSLKSNTTGIDNTAVGYNALKTNTIGSYCNAFGSEALSLNSSGSGNNAFGDIALKNNTTGGSNSAFGDSALASNTTGAFNSAFGAQALSSCVSSVYNVAIGAYALKSLASGTGENVAIGFQALYTAVNARDCVAVGYNSLRLNLDNANSAVGSYSLENNTTGYDNSSFGFGCLRANTTGFKNSAFGVASLDVNTIGSENAAFGADSLGANTTGSQNTALGRLSGSNITTGTNLTCIGYNSRASSATAANEITLGNSSVTSLRCAVTTITAISDKRDKKNIEKLELGLEFIRALNPCGWNYDIRGDYENGKSDGSKMHKNRDYGFIAQDLQDVQKKFNIDLGLVMEDNPDRLEATPGKLLTVLVKAVQELAERLETVEGRK